jgi:hypothetical protein
MILVVVVRVRLVIKYSASPYWHHKEEIPQLPWPRQAVGIVVDALMAAGMFVVHFSPNDVVITVDVVTIGVVIAAP